MEKMEWKSVLRVMNARLKECMKAEIVLLASTMIRVIQTKHNALLAHQEHSARALKLKNQLSAFLVSLAILSLVLFLLLFALQDLIVKSILQLTSPRHQYKITTGLYGVSKVLTA